MVRSGGDSIGNEDKKEEEQKFAIKIRLTETVRQLAVVSGTTNKQINERGKGSGQGFFAEEKMKQT